MVTSYGLHYYIMKYCDQYKANGLEVTPVCQYGRYFFFFFSWDFT